MKKKSVIIFIAFLLIFGAAFYIINELLDLQVATTVDITGDELGKGNEIEPVVDDELMFLLLGVDKNPDVSEEQQDDHVRTDTMILVNVNFDKGTIDLISIPRDTKVNYNGSNIKINAAHAYDGKVGALKAVRQLTGLDIDYFMSVDYNAVLRLVEVIGGVEVDSPQVIEAPEIGVYIPKGKSVLDEKQSLYFLRAREVLKNGSDFERMENQQYFLKQLAKEVTKISNLPKIPKLLKVFKDNVEHNLSLGNFGSILLQAVKFDSSKMTTMTLEGTTGREYNGNGNPVDYFYVDKEKMNKLFLEKYPEYFFNKSQINSYE
ncbi:LCP family protein [Miniphocaeibacter halophilus]|uniref:LCP family protein n=1 Tax=Miniphocaeibacter halophilus TaxID=2931922 RepID=A0AC61MQR2_9FIRM|nr:LCP family protein [Miniphocaeibacter halophilus]QQK08015.1 LCP family protein [Miniphocaeibacter halophilus]